MRQGLEALDYAEHTDYDLVESTNPAFNKALVRINVFRAHRQARALPARGAVALRIAVPAVRPLFARVTVGEMQAPMLCCTRVVELTPVGARHTRTLAASRHATQGVHPGARRGSVQPLAAHTAHTIQARARKWARDGGARRRCSTSSRSTMSAWRRRSSW
jgi:hypothetical protein